MSSDLRSSKQQTKDELKELYDEMTDPEVMDRKKLRDERDERIKEKSEDYGL